jgi:thiamine biosynthesis lipoprotein
MAEERQTSRRDLLRGKKTVGLPSDLERPTSSAIQSGYLAEYSKPAMACQFQVLLNMKQYSQGPQAVTDGFELLDLLEDQLTVYRDHSEVSQLNRSASIGPTPVETRLFHLLRLANRICDETSGAFDITASPLTKLWGFDQRSGVMPDHADIAQVLQRVGSSNLRLDGDRETVQFLNPETRISLGGIGKGHAIDRMAEMFRQRDVNDFIIHGGQSSVLAHGSQDDFSGNAHPNPSANPSSASTTNSPDGWKVGLSHPTVPNFRLAEFTLRNQALGTSGTGRQGFFHQGKRYGHIINPRTGWPTDHVHSSTVISSSAALSDALATAFFVMQLDEVEAYCNDHPNISALLVVPGKSKGQIDLEWFNLTDEQWKRLV